MSELLKKASIDITKLVLIEKHSHMRKVWEMLLGGLIVPVLLEGDKTFLESNPKYKELMETYNKEAIKKFLKATPKEIKIKEQVTVEIPVDENSSLFRRIKKEVNKETRKKRELNAVERNAIIKWWNDNQRLMIKDDPICAKIIDDLHPAGDRPISPLQISGFFSLICRKGLEIEEKRTEYWNKRKTDGNIDIVPVYTDAGLKAIQSTWTLNKKEKSAIINDHEELIHRREAGDQTPLKVKRLKEVSRTVLKPVTEESGSLVKPTTEEAAPTAELAPEFPETAKEEELEIKFV